MKIAIVLVGERSFGETLRCIASHVSMPHDLHVVGVGVVNKYVTHQVSFGVSFEVACRSFLRVAKHSLYTWYWFLASGTLFDLDILSECLSSPSSDDILFPGSDRRGCLVRGSFVYDDDGMPTKFLYPSFPVTWPSLVGEPFVNQTEIFSSAGSFKVCPECLALRVDMERLHSHIRAVHGGKNA